MNFGRGKLMAVTAAMLMILMGGAYLLGAPEAAPAGDAAADAGSDAAPSEGLTDAATDAPQDDVEAPGSTCADACDESCPGTCEDPCEQPCGTECESDCNDGDGREDEKKDDDSEAALPELRLYLVSDENTCTADQNHLFTTMGSPHIECTVPYSDPGVKAATFHATGHFAQGYEEGANVTGTIFVKIISGEVNMREVRIYLNACNADSQAIKTLGSTSLDAAAYPLEDGFRKVPFQFVTEASPTGADNILCLHIESHFSATSMSLRFPDDGSAMVQIKPPPEGDAA